MKLSEKGIETIFSALLKTIEERDLVFRGISQGVFKKHIEALEFEPDDFVGGCCQNGKGHVTLTVEEANSLHHRVDWVLKHTRLSGMKKLFLEQARDFLSKRIEQAEKQDGQAL